MPLLSYHNCFSVSPTVMTLIDSDFTVVTKDSQVSKTFDFVDSKECLGFYSKVLSYGRAACK